MFGVIVAKLHLTTKEIEDFHPHTDECEPDERNLRRNSAFKESVQGGYRHLKEAYDTIALMQSL